MRKQSVCISVSSRSLVRLNETFYPRMRHAYACLNRKVFSGNTMRHPKLRTFREIEDMDEPKRFIPRCQKRRDLLRDAMA